MNYGLAQDRKLNALPQFITDDRMPRREGEASVLFFTTERVG